MSIVKDSITLRNALSDRFKYLYPSNNKNGFKADAIIKDAMERGFKITASSLSRYVNGDVHKNSLSETQCLWLCFRYGIPIQLAVGKPVIKDGKIVFEIPKFNEEESIKLLKLVFGNG